MVELCVGGTLPTGGGDVSKENASPLHHLSFIIAHLALLLSTAEFTIEGVSIERIGLSRRNALGFDGLWCRDR